MKKKYLSFPSWKEKNAAPKMNNRRMGFSVERSFVTRSYKSDSGEGEGTEADTEAKAIEAIGDQVKKFSDLLGEKADKAAIENLTKQINDLKENISKMEADKIMKAIESINEANEKLFKQVLEMQEEANRAKEAGAGGSKKSVGISTKEVEEFIKATFDEDGNKTHKAAAIRVKAAETFGVATFYEGGPDTDTTAFTGRVIDPVLYQRNRKKNLILDNFTITSIGVPTLLYLVKIEDGDDESSSAGDSGSAEWILSSEAKPKRSFRVTTGKAEAKKIAIFGTVEDKLLRDVSSLEMWIREDFTQEMREAINDGLLNNDVDVNPKAPQGLKQEAILFTPTTAWDNSQPDANYIDAILAIKATFARNKETLDRVFVSTSVVTKIMGLKDADGRYLNNGLVYVDSLGRLFIGGVLVVEADDEDVPDTHILAIGADMGFKMRAYGPMVFERGLNGEDFRYDRTSFRGYQEFLTYLPTHREKSVMYDTFVNIFAAILKPEQQA